MKIKITGHSSNLNGERLRMGQVLDVDGAVAKAFIETNQAERVVEPAAEDEPEAGKRRAAK